MSDIFNMDNFGFGSFGEQADGLPVASGFSFDNVEDTSEDDSDVSDVKTDMEQVNDSSESEEDTEPEAFDLLEKIANDEVEEVKVAEKIEDELVPEKTEQKRRMTLSELSQYFLEHGGSSANASHYGMATDTNPMVVHKEGQVSQYLVIPDLHLWYKNIRSRRDYVEEMQDYLKFIETTVAANPQLNNVILAGDVFHRGFGSLDTSLGYSEFFYRLKLVLNDRGGDLYSVFGNHEFTYCQNNPFWHLVDSIIKTPQDIYDNGVHIFLDGFPSRKSNRDYVPVVSADICVTHTEVLPPELKTLVQNDRGIKIFTSSHCMAFDRFHVKDLFIGHMHQIAERFTVKVEPDMGMRLESDQPEFMNIQYLGSLGRTSVAEVSNEYLERNLPLITIQTNGEYTVEQVPLMLRSFDDTVIKTEVIKNKQAHEQQKVFQQMRVEKVVENPIQVMKDKYESIPLVGTILDAAMSQQHSAFYLQTISSLDSIDKL